MFRFLFIFVTFISSNSLAYTVKSFQDAQPDLHEVADVINQAYRPVPFIKDGVDRVDLKDLEEVLADSNKILFICLHEGKVCGTVVLDYSSKNLEMSILAVHPTLQGKGIGNMLIEYVEQKCMTAGKDLYLNVIPVAQEALVVFYIKNGFKFTGDYYSFDKAILDRYIKPEYSKNIFYVGMIKKLI